MSVVVVWWHGTAAAASIIFNCNPPNHTLWHRLLLYNSHNWLNIRLTSKAAFSFQSCSLTFSNVQFSLHHNSYFAGFPKGPNMSENERKIAFGESTKWQFTRLMTPWNLWSSLFSTCPYFHGVFFGAFEDGRWPSNRSWLREQKVLCSEKLNV